MEEIGHEHARKALHVLDGMRAPSLKAHRPAQKKARLAELLAEQPSLPVPYLADHLRLGHSTVYRWMAKYIIGVLSIDKHARQRMRRYSGQGEKDHVLGLKGSTAHARGT